MGSFEGNLADSLADDFTGSFGDSFVVFITSSLRPFGEYFASNFTRCYYFLQQVVSCSVLLSDV